MLGLCLVLTLLDSVHFRRALPAAEGQAPGQVFYDTRTESLLDALLARQIGMRETTYSAPLGYLAITKQTVTRDGQTVRELPRLIHGGAHLTDPATQWEADLWRRGSTGALWGLGVALAHDTVARDLIASGRLVRPVPFAIPMKEAYYLIAPEGSHINAAAKAFKVWLLREMLE